jgi:hypothetical protein
VSNPEHVSRGVAAVTLDGVAATDAWIDLVDDASTHVVTIVLGASTLSPALLARPAKTP